MHKNEKVLEHLLHKMEGNAVKCPILIFVSIPNFIDKTIQSEGCLRLFTQSEYLPFKVFHDVPLEIQINATVTCLHSPPFLL